METKSGDKSGESKKNEQAQKIEEQQDQNKKSQEARAEEAAGKPFTSGKLFGHHGLPEPHPFTQQPGTQGGQPNPYSQYGQPGQPTGFYPYPAGQVFGGPQAAPGFHPSSPQVYAHQPVALQNGYNPVQSQGQPGQIVAPHPGQPQPGFHANVTGQPSMHPHARGEFDPRGAPIPQSITHPGYQTAHQPVYGAPYHSYDLGALHYQVSYQIPPSHAIDGPSGLERFRHSVAEWDSERRKTQHAQGELQGAPRKGVQGSEEKDVKENDGTKQQALQGDHYAHPNPRDFDTRYPSNVGPYQPYHAYPPGHPYNQHPPSPLISHAPHPYSPYHPYPSTHPLQVPVPGPFELQYSPYDAQQSPIHYTTPVHAPYHPFDGGISRRDDRDDREERERRDKKNRRNDRSQKDSRDDKEDSKKMDEEKKQK